VLQFRPVDQKGVFHPLAQRGDFGQLQIDAVAGQQAGDGVEQSDSVAGRDTEQPTLGLVVGPQIDPRGNGKALDPA
jgi:hypothetical protein